MVILTFVSWLWSILHILISFNNNFLCVWVDLPGEQRLEALQSAVVLLPDENREVLQSLLFFLYDISTQAEDHQMTASNLAVCFAPSLFNMSGTKSVTQSPSPRRPRKNLGVPDARELQEQKAAHECLTTLIQECKKLFNVSIFSMEKNLNISFSFTMLVFYSSI